MKAHNKKRNVGLLFEFLVRYITASLIEGREADSNQAVALLKRHFKPGTELYKEYRLFNSLVKTTVSSDAVAGSILSEAKAAVRRIDTKKLEHEKSMLIRGINHELNDDEFYSRPISEYKTYATISTLFSDWRDRSSDFDVDRLVSYESKLIEWLLKVREPAKQLEELKDVSVDRLVVKLMSEKVNKKYEGKLTNEQRDLIQRFVFSRASDDTTKLLETLNELRTQTIQMIDSFVTDDENDPSTTNILKEVRSTVLSKPIDTLDDAAIETYLKIIQLRDEFRTE